MQRKMGNLKLIFSLKFKSKENIFLVFASNTSYHRSKMIMFVSAVVWLLFLSTTMADNMNDLTYKVANSDIYTADFGNADFFEVYSPLIRTRYSEVHWTTQDPVPLSDEIRARFENKTMAVVGYEVDQVYHQKDSAGNDASVPITYTYCHHYNAWLLNGRKTAIFDHKKTKDKGKGDNKGMPLIQTFSSGNGGEFRGSYKGFPKGYAQLIDSPDSFQATIMQIDTWNREEMRENNPKFMPGPLPKIAQYRFSDSADLSPLVECPCSDRVEKKWGMEYKLKGDTCENPIESAEECWKAAAQLVQTVDPLHRRALSPEDHAHEYPIGCSLEYQEMDGMFAFWNPLNTSSFSLRVASDTSITTPDASKDKLIAMASNQVNVTVELDTSNDLVTITLVGPADHWFGVAFGSHSMCTRMVSDQCPDGGPNAIIISGDNITERVLDYHGAGRLIEYSFLSSSISVKGDNHTVVLTRPIEGLTQDHYTFDTSVLSDSGVLPIITARGCDLEYAQHCGHGPATLNFLPAEEKGAKRVVNHICRKGIEGTINGRPFNGGGHQRCEAFPLGDLVDQHNPTCNIETYEGGLLCCNHGHSLLDTDQDIPWPDQYLEYHMKFRFYFEEYTPSDSSLTPFNGSSHASNKTESLSYQNLVSLFWMTEANAQEYDVPACPEGTPPSQCLHVITSHFQVKDMLFNCSIYPDASSCTGVGSTDPTETQGIKLIYASAHCHASSCHSMELYNADTGQLLCRVEPIVGQSDNTLYDERGFLALPPCLWSDNADEKNLSAPELLTLNTKLLSVKRSNTTFPHFGDMAMWQMRGVVVPGNGSSSSSSSNQSGQNEAEGNDKGDVHNPSNGKEGSSATGYGGAAMLIFVFLGWCISCFVLSLLVWNMAFSPSQLVEPDIYFPPREPANMDQMITFLHNSPHEV